MDSLAAGRFRGVRPIVNFESKITPRCQRERGAVTRVALDRLPAHAELAPDPFHVDGLPLVDEARIAGDDKEPSDTGKRGDDLLDHAVREILLLRIAANVLERQHSN